MVRGAQAVQYAGEQLGGFRGHLLFQGLEFGGQVLGRLGGLRLARGIGIGRLGHGQCDNLYRLWRRKSDHVWLRLDDCRRLRIAFAEEACEETELGLGGRRP